MSDNLLRRLGKLAEKRGVGIRLRLVTFYLRLRSQLAGVASLASEGKSMVSNGTRHKIGAGLAHLAASAGKSAIDAGPPRSSQHAVVFIIDDDVAVREALHSLLRDVRLQAEVFGSPTELLASKLPDALLSGARHPAAGVTRMTPAV
jgi:hypothetical protein